jgi:hypothetical protein
MRLQIYAAGALLGACLLAGPAPTSAAPLAGAMSKDLATQVDANLLVIQVQHHRHGGRGYHRGSGGDGGAVAAGVIGGLFLGAIIASEAQRQQAIEYCARRYRSFDPQSMTYLGRNGIRYRCP